MILSRIEVYILIICVFLYHLCISFVFSGERPFKCHFEGCGSVFTTSILGKVHIRTHTGERPYYCTEPGCGRAFASATNYKNHVRIHTGNTVSSSWSSIFQGSVLTPASPINHLQESLLLPTTAVDYIT